MYIVNLRCSFLTSVAKKLFSISESTVARVPPKRRHIVCKYMYIYINKILIRMITGDYGKWKKLGLNEEEEEDGEEEEEEGDDSEDY